MLSDDEVGAVLQQAVELENWVKHLKDYALAAVLDGKTIPGWKAVEGRGSRNWTADVSDIEARLASLGYDPCMAYERKVQSVAQLEK